jgi:hypothetical protein
VNPDSVINLEYSYDYFVERRKIMPVSRQQHDYRMNLGLATNSRGRFNIFDFPYNAP